MIKGSIKWSGGKELSAALAQLPQRTSARFVREALVEAAEPMRKSMQARAPVDEGTLKGAIVISKASGTDSREMAVAVGPTRFGFWGSFQEFGTAHHAAQPFARPAFDATWQESLRILGAALWRDLSARGISRVTETVDSVVEGEDVKQRAEFLNAFFRE